MKSGVYRVEVLSLESWFWLGIGKGVTSCHRGPREQSGARRDPADLSMRE